MHTIRWDSKYKIIQFYFFFIKIFFSSTTPTEKPAISNLPFSYVPGISAVSPITNYEISHPFLIPIIKDLSFLDQFYLLIYSLKKLKV